MPVIAKLFSLFRPSQFSITKAFGMLSLLMGLLASLAMPQLAFAQTQITNTASISAPATVTNTNTATACVAGTCSAADSDTITASVPLVAKTFTPSTITAGGTSLLVITFTNTHKLVSATFSTAFVDIYPAGMTNAAAPLAATTCLAAVPTAAPGGSQVSLPVGTLVAPNSSCSVSVVVTSSTSPQAANTIPAGSLTTSVGANPTLITATLTVSPSADLAITKTTSNATPNAGGTFTYTIVIGNNGPSAVTNATWTDTLPTGLGTITNIVPSAGITAAAVGGTISGTSTLANGQSATVTFQVSVAPGATGTLTNTASVTPPVGTTDPTPGNNSSSVPVTVGLVADLGITKTPSTGNPSAGGTFTYTIVIVNNGPSNVTNATWTDTLPTGLGTITNIVPSAGITAAAVGGTISGTSTLANGQSATVTFQVSVAPGATGTLTNTASVTAPVGTTDPTPGNNTSSVPVTVGLVADLAITKTTSNATPNAGGTFTYTIVIGNNGPSAVTNATWTDTLPTGLGTITNIVPSAGITAAAVGSTISGTSTLANGQVATVTFQVSVAPGATGTLTNTASVTPPVGTTDPTPGNNTSSVPVTVGLVADLAITKTTSNATPNAGGTFTYTIVIGNNGPSAVTNATWTDTLPTGLGTITNIVPSAGITAAAVGSTISGTSTLANGQVATVTFQVSVAPGATGTLTNTASVTPPVGTTDPTPGNNSSSVPVTVGLVADLGITKTPSTGNPSAGGTFTYTIVIVNNGPSNVTNATWTDTLPTGLGTITNIVPSAGITAAAVGGTISGTSTLANGQSATVTFQVSVAPGATGTLTNTASVTAPVGTTDPTPGNNTSSTPVTIGQLANLSVAKTNGTTSVTAGGTTAYTITFSNGGPSAANGALVKDVQSAGLQCTSVTCTATTGGASCPSSMLPLGTAVLSGATNFFNATGETIGTFPANSTVTLVVNCNVTATGQ